MTRREEPIPALSAGLSYVVLTGLALSAVLPAFLPLRDVQHIPHPRIRDAFVAPGPVASPATSPVAVAEPQAKDEWLQADIMHGRERCMHLLAGTQADVEMLDPIKKGECGLPAPVRLKSVGSDPKVVFDPPVDVNCQMVSALGKWVKSTLQPRARDQLKSPVVRVVGGSGYSCRNIYNLPNAKLSQHALANAIDVGGFALADGRTIRVLKGWGLTARDIEAQAKAKAAAEAKAKSARSKDDARAQGAKGTDATGPGKQDKPVMQASLTPSAQKPLVREDKSKQTGLPPVKAAEPPKPTKEALFLRAIHTGACHQFGTVLGPEANDPHRNHFHLDLIPRRGRSTCE